MIWEKIERFKATILSFFFIDNNQEAEKRGEESEQKVFKVVEGMLQWNELPDQIRGVYPFRTERWSNLDMRGVDIVIPTTQGNIYVQVKSSAFGFERFVRDRRNRNIVCIVGTDDEKTILIALKKKLCTAYRHPNDRYDT